MSLEVKKAIESLTWKVPQLATALYFDSLDSTNTEALRQARENILAPALFVAKTQSVGRGRLQRSWQSIADKGLYTSLLFEPQISLKEIPLLSLAGALALVKSLKELGWQTTLKWPNDVLLSGKKVAGILCEMELNSEKKAWVVVGLGLNLSQTSKDFSPEFRELATSLTQAGKEAPPLENILCLWLQEFFLIEKLLVTQGTSALIKQWEQHTLMLGKTVELQETFEKSDSNKPQVFKGKILGLNQNGHLRLQLADGKIEAFAAGDVTVVNNE